MAPSAHCSPVDRPLHKALNSGQVQIPGEEFLSYLSFFFPSNWCDIAQPGLIFKGDTCKRSGLMFLKKWFLKGDRNHGQGGQNIHEQRFVTQLLTGPHINMKTLLIYRFSLVFQFGAFKMYETQAISCHKWFSYDATFFSSWYV